MKVADIMSKETDFVTPDTRVKDLCHLIFIGGINGIPVCKDGKLVGFISERDILAQFYPSMQEYVEDPVHLSDFEQMERKVSEIFSMRAQKIMSKKLTVVTEDAPLLHALSLMLTNRITKLPVVDKKGNFIGTLSKADIFRAIVGDKLALVSSEEYHDWLSRHYDIVVNWKKRLGSEIPDLVKLFKEEKVKSILDVGCGTGEHDINLAMEGFRVLGVESSILMHEKAKKKKEKLPKGDFEKIDFMQGEYIKVLEGMTKKFDAAIFMGNAFPHLVKNYKEVLSAVTRLLELRESLIVLQIINFEKAIEINKGLLDVNFATSRLGAGFENMFVEFYDPPGKSGNLTLNMAIFDFDGKKWRFRSLNSTPIANITQKVIASLLEKNGFKNIVLYGSNFWGPLFSEPFHPLQSDFLNVVARR